MMKYLIPTLAVVVLGGCAAVQIPADRLARSEASIRGAEEVGANSVPEARLHLQLARDETTTARRMAAEGDERALLVMSRAEADAELALGLARESQVHNEALRAAQELKELQSRPGATTPTSPTSPEFPSTPAFPPSPSEPHDTPSIP